MLVVTAAVVTAAGVDTWSPSWYVDPDGAAARWLQERCTARAARGSQLLPEKVLGYTVGWFPSGLVFAEGHPDPEGELCPASELVARVLALQEALDGLGLPLPLRERPFAHLGASSEGWAGLRRVDATVNLAMGNRADGLAVLAGIAACARDAPGHAEVRYGSDRGVETVYLLATGGRRRLGRWYDKALEAAAGPRGTLIRGEDQRRWAKGERRDPWELTGVALREGFRRRFAPLWKATKGVTVTGPVVIAERLVEAVAAGELTPAEADALGAEVFFSAVGGSGRHRSTRYRRQRRIRQLGLTLADGVLEEVEVDVAAVLEAALETDAWERRG